MVWAFRLAVRLDLAVMALVSLLLLGAALRVPRSPGNRLRYACHSQWRRSGSAFLPKKLKSGAPPSL